MADPSLELHAGNEALMTSNDHWKDSPDRSRSNRPVGRRQTITSLQSSGRWYRAFTLEFSLEKTIRLGSR